MPTLRLRNFRPIRLTYIKFQKWRTPWPEKNSIRRADTKPIMARRPFQLSAWEVKPQAQPLRSLGELMTFVEVFIDLTPNFAISLIEESEKFSVDSVWESRNTSPVSIDVSGVSDTSCLEPLWDCCAQSKVSGSTYEICAEPGSQRVGDWILNLRWVRLLNSWLLAAQYGSKLWTC